MYKIGLISDVHGNDVALKIALDKLKGQVDEIICLGDLIGIGPNGNEVIDIVRKLDKFSTVLGNHERYYIYGFDNPLSCTETAHQDWQRASISKENWEYIKKIPIEINREYNGIRFKFMHYARFSEDSMFFTHLVPNPDVSHLDEVYKGHDADVIIYGHEHMYSYFKSDVTGKTYINVGALGCPYPVVNEGRYAILEITDTGFIYKRYTFKYDPSKVKEDAFKKRMPQAEFIISNFYDCLGNNTKY